MSKIFADAFMPIGSIKSITEKLNINQDMETKEFENESVTSMLNDIKALIDVESLEDKVIAITITTRGDKGFYGSISYL